MSRLRSLVIAAIWILALPASSQVPLELPAAERAAIRGVIEGQLEAFARDDGVAAFGFATPSIQAMFGTPESFLDMVRRSYAAVHRPRAVAFAELLGDPDHPVQLVHLVGPGGETVIAAYEMTRFADGMWRINGCVLLPLPQRAT